MKGRLPIILAVVLALVLIAVVVYNVLNPPKLDTLVDLPLPGNIDYYSELSPEMITFETDMSIADTLAFYRDALTKKGYTERTQLTYHHENTGFGLVFDGHFSGKEFIIQGIHLREKTNMTLRFRDADTQ